MVFYHNIFEGDTYIYNKKKNNMRVNNVRYFNFSPLMLVYNVECQLIIFYIFLIVNILKKI